MTHDGMPDHARRLHRFVNEAQAFAGVVGCPSSTPRARLQSFVRLLDATPDTTGDRIISERILSDALKRLYLAFGLPISRIGDGHLTLADIHGTFAALQDLRQ